MFNNYKATIFLFRNLRLLPEFIAEFSTDSIACAGARCNTSIRASCNFCLRVHLPRPSSPYDLHKIPFERYLRNTPRRYPILPVDYLIEIGDPTRFREKKMHRYLTASIRKCIASFQIFEQLRFSLQDFVAEF